MTTTEAKPEEDVEVPLSINNSQVVTTQPVPEFSLSSQRKVFLILALIFLPLKVD